MLSCSPARIYKVQGQNIYHLSNQQLGKLGTVKPLSQSKAIISKSIFWLFFPSLKTRPTSDFGIFMSARTFCTTFDVPVLLFVRADFIQPIPVTAVTPFTPANPLDPRQPLLPRHHRSPSPKTPQHVHESPQECPENTPLISEGPKTTPEHPQIIPEHPQITLGHSQITPRISPNHPQNTTGRPQKLSHSHTIHTWEKKRAK